MQPNANKTRRCILVSVQRLLPLLYPLALVCRGSAQEASGGGLRDEPLALSTPSSSSVDDARSAAIDHLDALIGRELAEALVVGLTPSDTSYVDYQMAVLQLRRGGERHGERIRQTLNTNADMANGMRRAMLSLLADVGTSPQDVAFLARLITEREHMEGTVEQREQDTLTSYRALAALARMAERAPGICRTGVRQVLTNAPENRARLLFVELETRSLATDEHRDLLERRGIGTSVEPDPEPSLPTAGERTIPLGAVVPPNN